MGGPLSNMYAPGPGISQVNAQQDPSQNWNSNPQQQPWSPPDQPQPWMNGPATELHAGGDHSSEVVDGSVAPASVPLGPPVFFNPSQFSGPVPSIRRHKYA